MPAKIKFKLIDVTSTFEDALESFLSEDFRGGNNNLENKKMIIEKMQKELLRNKEQILQLNSKNSSKNRFNP